MVATHPYNYVNFLKRQIWEKIFLRMVWRKRISNKGFEGLKDEVRI
jgi:hypothetical protein